MSGWDYNIMSQKDREKRCAKIEKKLDRDMEDLVSHIKCVTAETNALRDRVHEAEKVISALKSTGEQSIDQLMETLYMMKMRQAELDAESGALREEINDREAIMK